MCLYVRVCNEIYSCVSSGPVYVRYARVGKTGGQNSACLLYTSITPILYILYKTYRIRRHIQNPTLVYLLVAFFGQIACFMSNEFILAYPILVGILICYIKFYENSNI